MNALLDDITTSKTTLADPASGTSVGHKPAGKWAFDAAVTDVFPDMLARSIPGYADMRRLTFDIGRKFVQKKTDIVDLGCSRGDGLLPFLDEFGAGNRFLGFDESLPMVEACRSRLGTWMGTGLVDIRHKDIRDGLPPLQPSLTLAVLTLMFIPVECRQKIVADVYRMTRPGGAFIVVEKCLGSDAAATNLLVDTYHEMKRANGYSGDDVEAKRKSLQGVLVPLTAEGNEAMLKAEGFRVQRFWQSLQFAGWVCIKPKE